MNRVISALTLIPILLAGWVIAQQAIITTVTGPYMAPGLAQLISVVGAYSPAFGVTAGMYAPEWGFANIYIATGTHARVLAVDYAGQVSVVAGTGEPVDSGDGGLATEAGLVCPARVALDPRTGDTCIADPWANRVRKVDASGIITTLAGNGLSGYSGDDGPATDASLNFPCAVGVDSWGNIYIYDAGNE